MTTIESAGFIVLDNELIHGTGTTAQAAWDDLLNTMIQANIHMIDDRKYRTAEQEADDEAIQDAGGSWTKASGFRILPASAALLAQIDTHGGNLAWTYVSGVCCTVEEVDALDDAA